jgi:hypothetical protein
VDWDELRRWMACVSVVVFVKKSVLDGDVYLWQGVVCRGVYYDVYFRVFLLYTAPLVCIL